MSKPKYAADYYGVEITSILDGDVVDVNKDGGRVRSKYFTYTIPAGNIATAKVIALALLPKGARVIGGAIKFSAMSGSATLSLGLFGADASGKIGTATNDSATFFLSGISVVGAGVDTFAEMSANDANTMYLTEKQVILAGTTGGSAFPAAGTLVGHVKYVLD